MPRLTKEQRILLLKQWWISGGTTQAINEAFQQEFPDDEIPARQTVYRLAKKFDETGSVEDAPGRGRRKSVNTDENMQLVSQNYRLNPQTSQRQAARELDISRSTLQRINERSQLKTV